MTSPQKTSLVLVYFLYIALIATILVVENDAAKGEILNVGSDVAVDALILANAVVGNYS